MHACLFPGCLAHYIEVDVFQCDVPVFFHHCTTYICFLYNCLVFMELICAFFLFAQSSKYLSASISELSHENPWEHSTTPHAHALLVSFYSWRWACSHRWLCCAPGCWVAVLLKHFLAPLLLDHMSPLVSFTPILWWSLSSVTS